MSDTKEQEDRRRYLKIIKDKFNHLSTSELANLTRHWENIPESATWSTFLREKNWSKTNEDKAGKHSNRVEFKATWFKESRSFERWHSSVDQLAENVWRYVVKERARTNQTTAALIKSARTQDWYRISTAKGSLEERCIQCGSPLSSRSAWCQPNHYKSFDKWIKEQSPESTTFERNLKTKRSEFKKNL